MTTKELENYEPKGELTGFPKEIIARMLECQEEQGNKRDVTVFEKYKCSAKTEGGFDWDKTKEKDVFWGEVIVEKNFNRFFEKYPKKEDNSQEFKVGDKVYDIIRGRIGKVIGINTLNKDSCSILIDFNDNDEEIYFTLNGRNYDTDKHPRLLHYRDDYDYSVIDFNNLPKRQEVKRWRAEIEETYYSLSSDFKIEQHYEDNDSFNDEAYDSGNYFQTKEEVQELVDKLKEYFKQLINTKK
jgi:hypothetical protein